MGNISGSVSGFGAGDASRKSMRGSARSCRRKRTSTSCCLYAADNNWLLSVIAEKRRAKITSTRGLRERDQVNAGNEAGAARMLLSLEGLLDDCSSGAQNVDLDVASDCVSPFSVSQFTDVDSSGDFTSGYFSDAMISLRDDADDDEDAVVEREIQVMQIRLYSPRSKNVTNYTTDRKKSSKERSIPDTI